jgi:alpha-L-rhamnosidase
MILLACVAPSVAAAASPVEVTELRVDQMAGPLGIDNPVPSLGWQLRSERRGELQSAYRVQVATSAAEFESAPVWDSGKVESSESVSVPYAGPALTSAQRYAWRVRVWDRDGDASEWSEPSSWEMGLLEPDDWQGAEWVRPQAPTDAASWTDYRLEASFTIAAGAAGVVFRVRDPSSFYMWQVLVDAGEEAVFLRPHVHENGKWRVLDEVDLSAAVPFADALTQHEIAIELDGPTIATEIDGVPVDERDDHSFTAGGIGFRSGDDSEDASFDDLVVRDLDGEELFSDDFSATPDPAFPGAEIAAGALRSSDGALDLISTAPPVPLLRKEFELTRPATDIVSARAYAYGLGFYELRLNGEKAGDRVLAPATSDFERRLRYQTYDVTELLRAGGNALGLTLSEGYGPAFSRFGWRWLGPRQALLVVDVAYEDDDGGLEHQYVVSDDSWRWSDGPIRAASIYHGEAYDARLERDGWDEPGFDDSGWQPTAVASPPGGELEADTTPPIRVVETIEPAAVTEPDADVHVFDLGKNVAGWARLRAQGPAGTTVRMRYAENLAADGSLDPFTNRNAAAADTFVLAGTGEPETYEPSFTYHGFRYVEVTGLPGPVTLDGRVVRADLAPTASFESSSPLLDAIYANNRRTMANNAMSYPTDTPTRDERTGPGMDVHAHGDAATRDFRAGRFFAAYLQELERGAGGSPDMNAANVPLAWSLYEQYGDRPQLSASYPAMKASVDAYEEDSTGLVWPDPEPGERNGFGDWCPPPPDEEANGGLGGPHAGGYEYCFSEVSLVNTALAYRSAGIVARAAAALDEPAEADHYEQLAEQIGAAFEAEFGAGAGGYGSGRQVTGVLPLAFGMVPSERMEAVSQALVERVTGDDLGHLDTGIFGTRFLVDALVAAGRPDVALTALGQTSYPGFGYQIGLGATTAWEQWIYRSGMGTHDHAMFAGVNASLLSRFGGLEPLEPGYAKLRIDPELPDGLDRVAASLRTVRGEVGSAWERSGGDLSLDVTVPPNATAEVLVPVALGGEVHESGVPAEESPGVVFGGVVDGKALYAVGSGEYSFTTASTPVEPEPEPEPEPELEPEPSDETGPEGGTDRAPGPPPTAAPLTRPAVTGSGRLSLRAPRLRVRGRLGGRRLLLTIVCRAGCPAGKGRRVRMTVTPVGRRRPVLARARTRLRRGHNRVAVRLRGRLRPRRVKLRIAGLSGRPAVTTARLARHRR